MIFKSTQFGDDTDRAMQKNDGAWTYFANDVGYHMDKVNRNYDYLINVLWADHTGYTKRITAAVNALSNNKVKLNLLLFAITALIFSTFGVLECNLNQDSIENYLRKTIW